MTEFQDFLTERRIKYQKDVSFEKLSFLKLGGTCALMVYPKNESEFSAALLKARTLNAKFKVVGRMSNILPPDGFFEGALISTALMNHISAEGTLVRAECGCTLPSLSAYLAKNALSATEELSGIPASVGGAVYMNAGAYGREISDVISEVRVFDAEKNAFLTLTKEELAFSYRKSILQNRELYVISVVFKTRRAISSSIYEKMSALSAKRRASQPINEPSLGSAFKRLNGVSAAELVDKCGLKGYSIGRAAISEKHAGFIVNRGGATSADYREIVKVAKAAVFERFGVKLEEEIEYL